ncbi:hypothetical protein OROMI_004661 [Orobanche minor]
MKNSSRNPSVRRFRQGFEVFCSNESSLLLSENRSVRGTMAEPRSFRMFGIEYRECTLLWTIVPGAPKKITMHPSELCKTLLPGQVIEDLALEVFDEYGNHVKEDESVLLRLDGFSFQGGRGIIRGAGIDCTKKKNSGKNLTCWKCGQSGHFF